MIQHRERTPEKIRLDNEQVAQRELQELLNKLFPDQDQPTNIEIGTVHSALNREDANKHIVAGRVIPTFNGVFALWFDGRNPQALEELLAIKGKRRREGDKPRPNSSAIPIREIVGMIDYNLIPQHMRDFFHDPKLITKYFGPLTFLRVPITEEAKAIIPDHMVYRIDGCDYLQNWNSRGIATTSRLLASLRQKGINMVAVSSMNRSGEPEIIDQREGVFFASEHNIPIILLDPKAETNLNSGLTRGSYSILQVGPSGISLMRDGTVKGKDLQRLVDGRFVIDTSQATRTKRDQHELPEELFSKGVKPEFLQLFITAYINGIPWEVISAAMEKKIPKHN